MKLIYNFDGSIIPMWVQLLFWLLYMVVFVYTFRKIVFHWRRNKLNEDVTYLFSIYFILFAVFYCINDDYFQYRNWIYGRDFSFWTKEKIYINIILFCRRLPFDYPYEVFRFVVWGGAVYISYYTFRMYRGLLLPVQVLLFLFVFYSNAFCYARASLAMAFYFMGIALYLYQKEWDMKLFGIVVAVSSILFHREMLVGIAILPCLFIPFEKQKISVLSVLLLIFAVIGINFISSNLELLDSIFDNDDLSTKMEGFAEKGQGVFRISTLFKYLNFFYPFYLITKCFWNKNIIIPHYIIGMYRTTYAIMMASVAFMIVFGLRSVYSYRVLYISMIPLSLLIGFCYYNGFLKKKQFAIIMILALLSNSVRLINAQ